MQKDTILAAMPQEAPTPIRFADPEIKQKLQELADADDRKLNYIINKACKEYVEREYPKLKKVIKSIRKP